MPNILKICQEVSFLACVQKPMDLFDESSETDSLFLYLAKETLLSLLSYGNWQVKEGVLRTRKGQTDYLISDVCSDFHSLVNNTIYIKDSGEKLIGSVSPEEFMKGKFFANTSLKFRIQNGIFRFLTPPPENIKIIFSYRPSTLVLSAKGEEKSDITENTDSPIFNTHLVKLGILWRWLKRSGLNYSEEFNEYERELKLNFAGSLSSGDIALSPSFEANKEGIVYVR